MGTKGRLKFGITLPQKFPDQKVDVGYISRFLAGVESLGYDSVWVGEGMLGSVPNLDPIPLLAYASASTTRVRLGVSVILSVLWSPVHLAKILATLDHLSGGRLIAGVGLGEGTKNYAAFGISAEGRLSRFEEGINLIKALWTREKVAFHGLYWQMDNTSISPRPVQQPSLPLWFGGHVAPALKRAVRMGDGWMGAGAASTKEFKSQLKLVRGYLEDQKRDPANFPVSKRVYVALDSSRERALGELQKACGYIYGDRDLAEKVAIFGGEQELIEGLEEILEEDVDMVLLNPVYDLMEQAQGLSADILPRLHARAGHHPQLIPVPSRQRPNSG